MEKDIQILLKQAIEIVNKVVDPELTDMIHRFDYTPSPKLNLDVNDHLKIYNWLCELELYKKIYGPIGNL